MSTAVAEWWRFGRNDVQPNSSKRRKTPSSRLAEKDAPETRPQKPKTSQRHPNEPRQTPPAPVVLSPIKAAPALRTVSASTSTLSLPLPEEVYAALRADDPSSAGLAESDLVARFSAVPHVDTAARAYHGAFLYLDRIVGAQTGYFYNCSPSSWTRLARRCRRPGRAVAGAAPDWASNARAVANLRRSRRASLERKLGDETTSATAVVPALGAGDAPSRRGRPARGAAPCAAAPCARGAAQPSCEPGEEAG
jgi:hypothetical protein